MTVRTGASRRDVLTAAAVSAAVAAATAPSAAAAVSADAIWSGEYWAQKGQVSLYMFRKRVGAPTQGRTDRPVVMLVHGSSLTGRSSFDLSGGGIDYSMMDALARGGFDVWTMDHEGYGRSTDTGSNSDTAIGAADLVAAITVIRRETGLSKVHFFGESSGALRAGMFANQHPEMVDRLILGAFTNTGVGSPTLIERAKQLDYYRTHNRRPRDRAMVESIFTRDGLPSNPTIVRVLADRELSYGETVPSGTYLDMTSKLPLVDPAKINSPLMLIRGEHDGIATLPDLFDFFAKVPGDTKQFAIVPGAHSLTLSTGYRQMWHAVQAFLTTPASPEAA